MGGRLRRVAVKHRVLLSVIYLGGVMAYGASDARAHSVRATAAPPFLWTDVDSSQAQRIATEISEELGRIHDFAPGTFLGSRLAGAPNHPFGLGIMADFDDKGFDSNEHGHLHASPISNGASLGNANNDADSALNRFFTSGGLNGLLGGGGGVGGEGRDRSAPGSGGPTGNQSSQNSHGDDKQNSQWNDESDPPGPAVSS